MKYTDLVGSGYLVLNLDLTESTADNTQATVFYDVKEGYEIRVKGARIGGLSRFIGKDAKTYLIEYTDYMGEGRSQFDRVYLNEDIPVSVTEVKRVAVLEG